MKTTSVKFTRNPKYTPASLSARQLSRIEWLVKALFERRIAGVNKYGHDMVFSGNEAVNDITKKWFAPLWAFDRKPHPEFGEVEDYSKVEQRKLDHDRRLAWLSSNKDAKIYFANCWKYLVAVALRNGEIKEPERHSAAWYAERQYGYN